MNTKRTKEAMKWLCVAVAAIFLAVGCGGSGGGGGESGSNTNYSDTNDTNDSDITAPMISAVIPVSGSVDVAVNTAISANFSEAMDSSTVTTTTFTLKQGTTVVSGTVFYSGTTATFTPLSNLSYGITYTATITTGVKNVAGNSLSTDFVWSFTTGAYLDTTPPLVSSTSPANNTTSAATNSAVSAVFSEAMDASTINDITFVLKRGTTFIAGTVAYSGTTATFTPSSNLEYSTTYTATITTGAKDLAGNAMEADYAWSFTTGTVPDTTSPTVISTSPANNATEIAINGAITATFSETMTASTVTTATFTLKQGTTVISGTVAYSDTTATFTLSSNLSYSTVYTATITTGAKDLAGNAMATDYVWSFTTDAAPAPSSGSLDTSFDSDGTAILGVSAWPGTDQIKSIAIQSDGKIVAVGRAEGDSAVARFNSDGSLDTSFDGDGIITTSAGSYYSIVIQSDGKIVVGGASSSSDFAIARYNSDGSIDATFGSSGIATINAGSTDYANSVSLQSDGKIVAVGQSGDNVAAIRVESDGSPDTSFDGDGIVITTIGSGTSSATDVAVQGDGKIVVSGWILDSGSGYYGWLVIRYNSDGSLDTSFDGDGKATTVVGINYNSYYYNDFAYAISIQSDGKIVVGGGTGGNCVPSNCTEEYKFALVRYNTDGLPDATFGSGGIQLGNNTAAYIKDLAIQSDGKIVATGPLTSKSAFIVTRFNTNGTPDSTFIDENQSIFDPFDPVGEEGEVIVAPYQNGFYWNEAYAIAIQSDGKIVVGGYACGGVNGVNPEFAIIRLWP